jgi:hypothetical protein
MAAVLLCSALLANAPAANANANQSAPRLVYSYRVAGPTSAASPAAAPGYDIWYGASPYPTLCADHEICIWNQTGYTGYAIFFYGNYAACQGWRFEGSVWQDTTYSITNNASGPISIWDRYHDGSYNYNKYAWLGRGYTWGSTPFSYIMDGWAYDPGNTCPNPPSFGGRHVTWQP